MNSPMIEGLFWLTENIDVLDLSSRYFALCEFTNLLEIFLLWCAKLARSAAFQQLAHAQKTRLVLLGKSIEKHPETNQT